MALGEGLERVVLRFGFMEEPDVPCAIRLALDQRQLPDLDPDSLTYYVGRQTVIASEARPGMAVWREVLFAILNRNAELTGDYLRLPVGQLVEIGIPIEI